MRRIIGGSAAFLVLTGTLLVLPVYAAPVPAAAPVAPSISEVDLGSVADPAAEAVVATDGVVVAAGEDAEVVPGDVLDPSAADAAPAEQTPAAEEPTVPESPATESPVIESPADEAPVDEQAPAPTVSPDASGVAVSGTELAGTPALSVSQPESASFAAVGVTWTHDPTVTDVVVQVRVQGVDGTWGGWTTLEQDDAGVTDAPDGELRDGTAPYFTGPAGGVEVVVQAADGAQPADVRTQLVDPGTSTADATVGAQGPQDRANAASAMPAIFTRAQWGADESIRTWDPEYAPSIKAATIHHTADTNNYTEAQVPAMLRSIYAYHAVSRGWGDIGYNVIADKYGRLWEGRYGGLSSTVVGAHAGGFNSGTFGVSMLGNYAEVDTPQVMLDAVSAVIAWKFSLYGVDPRGTTRLTSGGGGTAKYAAGTVVTLPTIFGHRDVGNTTCPGQYAYDRLGQVRQSVADRMAAQKNPTGAVTGISGRGDVITLQGWATDPDTDGPVQVHVYADRVGGVAVVEASQVRSDVAGAHGFTATFRLPLGVYSICAYGINVGGGTGNTQLGCRTATMDEIAFNPTGSFDEPVAVGRDVTLGGTVTDPDTSGELAVHVYVDGRAVAVLQSAGAAGSGGRTWSSRTTLTDGTHTVCAYGINAGRGTSNVLLGCRSLTVSMAPTGGLGAVTAVGRQVSLSGWAQDPDTPSSPIPVHVYVNGRGAAVLTADRSAHGGHAFEGTLTTSDGPQYVCAYAINVGQGSTNTLLGCASVEVSMNPVGALTGVVAEGVRARVSGWTTDPDVPSTGIGVHLYLDGAPVAAVVANRTAAGVDGAHAFETVVPVTTPGVHTVCAYGLNVGLGTSNVLLGCRGVTVAATAFDPDGELDDLVRTGPTVTVSGRASDPDATAPVQVHVYVDGAGRGVLTADGADDPANAGRSFRGDLVLEVGQHSICSYAINQGQGTTNLLLGCQTVTVPEAAYNPTGAFTAATASGGSLTVRGWAVDPDAPTAATVVHVYVDGVGRAVLTADQTAAGVTGSHAFAGAVAASAGQHQVCTYAINTGRGTANVLLGCRSVQV